MKNIKQIKEFKKGLKACNQTMTPKICRTLWTVALVFISALSVQAQTRTIAIVKDNQTAFLDTLEQNLKKEINNLLLGQYKIIYQEFSGGGNTTQIKKQLERVSKTEQIDLLIALGLQSSTLLQQKTTHNIPSIASMVMDENPNETSRLANYTYISPYKSFEDLVDLFSSLFDITEIGVYGAPDSLISKDSIYIREDSGIQFFRTPPETLPHTIQGLLILPTAYSHPTSVNELLDKATNNGVPSFSVGEANNSAKWTVSIDDEKLMQPFIKKIALNTRYIFEGTNASEIAIYKKATPYELIINMENIRKIGKLPGQDYLERSALIKTSSFPNSKKFTLEKALALGLHSKISLKKSNTAIDKSKQEIKQAKGLFTPEITASASNVWLSDNLVASSLGQKGKRTLSGSMDLKQVLFSEPLFANLFIKKILNERSEERHRQVVLDAVMTISKNYVSLLLAKADLDLQNENLNLIKQNLTAAKNKERLGAFQQSDVNRWVSELNLGYIKFKTAQTEYKKALYLLNEDLDQPIDTPYDLPEKINIEEVLSFPESIFPFLENELLLEKLAEFYISEMKKNAPEIEQLRLTNKAVSRQIRSAKKEFYLPKIVGYASANDILDIEGVESNPNLSVPPPPMDLTWSAGLGVELPILDNRKRKTEVELAKIDLKELEYSTQELTNALESKIRSQIQEFSLSYNSHQYAKNADTAASANFAQARASYQQGVISITQFLDAQSARFNAKLLLLQTQYKMVLDYILLERITGKIQFLIPEEDQIKYLNRLQQFLLLSK